MNFEEYWKHKKYQWPDNQLSSQESWDCCKSEILKLLEQNKELEAVSYSGKEIYKIYGNAIDKIRKEI